jgi:hypothetical protein
MLRVRVRLKSRPKRHKSSQLAAGRAPLPHHFYTIIAASADSHRNLQPVVCRNPDRRFSPTYAARCCTLRADCGPTPSFPCWLCAPRGGAVRQPRTLSPTGWTVTAGACAPQPAGPANRQRLPDMLRKNDERLHRGSMPGSQKVAPTSVRVESRTGAVALPRFPSPLIKPDVRISRIRLSDWLHLAAVGGAPMCIRRSRSRPSHLIGRKMTNSRHERKTCRKSRLQ